MASLHPHDLLEKTQGLTQCHFQPQNGYSLLGSFHVDARLLWCEIFGFFLVLFSQNERKMYYFCSVCIYFKESVFTFQLIQKLKSKHTSLKTYTKWAKLFFSLVLREREEKRNISHLLCHNHYIHLGRLTCNQN